MQVENELPVHFGRTGSASFQSTFKKHQEEQKDVA